MNPIARVAGDGALRLVTLAILFFGTFIASISPYQSLLAVEWFGFSDAQYAVIFTTGAGLSLLCALGVGAMNDRTGRRRNAARLAAGAGMAGALLAFLADARWGYLVAHLLFFPISATLFAQLFTLSRLAGSIHPAEERAGIQTVVRAAFAVPFIVVLPLWAVILGAGADLLWVYAACAVAAGATLAIFVFRWPRDGQTRWPDPGSGLGLGAALREISAPSVLVRVAALAGVMAGIQIYMILSGLILTATGRGTGDVALFAALVAGTEIPFMLVMGRPILRWGPVRLIAGAALLHAAFLTAFPLLGATPVVWLLAIVAGSAASVILTVPMLYLQDLLHRRPGAGGSLIALCNLGAQLIGAAIFAAGTALGGYALAAWIGAGVVAASGIAIAWLDRAGRPVYA
ncbi:putative MFS family arabinose efflux permease [Palleronia aestuarii]|uniref:Putative MFS family arabinose efflux permease n=1 Tax=Palleronia aestuarii TaxID=568105 RepID=A0A2W7P2H3_9RHOB|nr:MFS transporter [Palleronia aestuarii]PZX19626.1 putative MFS family arabinose efflux permease [Palleronia aestuarii]